MEKITKEQYEAAKVIVERYNSQLELEFKEKISNIKLDLAKYFDENEVCGHMIEEFGVRSNDSWFGTKSFDSAEIFSVIPFFDENYEDDKADADIEAIGLKYGIRLGWETGVYPK